MSEKIKNEDRTKCEIWTRVMGYHRSVDQFNIGKKSEFKERKFFKESSALKTLKKYKVAS